jgi:hypothetical protein
MINENPIFTKRHWQLIAGTILGGSSLIKSKKGKHYYLSMRGKDAKWLEYKAQWLNDFSSSTPFTEEKTNRWHSLCSPVFDQFQDLFYKDGKRYLDVEVLSQLWDFGLMIWYRDCGKYNKEITFNTHVWGESGSQTIVYYFELCGWNSKIIKERTYFRVKLDKESSIKLFKTIQIQN